MLQSPEHRSDPPEDDQDEQPSRSVEGHHEDRQVAEYPDVEPAHGVGHAAEGADGAAYSTTCEIPKIIFAAGVERLAGCA